MFSPLFKAVIFLMISIIPVRADDLGVARGEILLTVSGAIETTNADGMVQFDLEMLEALDATVINTSTIWTDGTQSFQGVSLDVLVDRLGISASKLRATAINDYAVDIPISDAVSGGPIIAYRLNGDTLSVRDKGPLWIVYPYDSDASYRSEVIYSRSIWQLDRIVVLD
ncbi:hypothetical protein SAMN04488040_3310 [Sulfitobacter marinus]|uniref:Oxidoreductase molybdopterin-binding domain-containing protein n=1 Tax=Sulfitobacter marinus TaxID=394264 RepID=A0A1I6VHK2_9RHOB|nr:molybdopterin-dependent oxidoreductase [Sulfitobacter marinus]SFT13127.1 hypothetical protein SAMN04488040_3310 [Sulfitobacter marinus]